MRRAAGAQRRAPTLHILWASGAASASWNGSDVLVLSPQVSEKGGGVTCYFCGIRGRGESQS
jgi:hypothetical protein